MKKLLSELHELYPSEIKYEENDIINHIYKNILRRNCIVSEELFNMNFNKQPNAWINKNEKISSYSLDYYPPIGWFGIGLNVNRYNDNNNWLDKKNGWATAYHGLRLLDTKDNRYHIKNCNKCENDNISIKCEDNYYLLNDYKSKCYHISEITEGEYYLSEDKTTYYSCKNIKYNSFLNCKNCTGNNT